MRRSLWTEVGVLVLFLALSTTLIAWSNADLVVSALFSRGGKWPVGLLLPWQVLYQMDRIPGISLAVFGLVVCVVSFFHREWMHWRRAGVFLVLLMVLGPGMIVNLGFKEYWGRPRPREITQFSGKKEFLQPWQIGNSGQGRSFPSGHSSAAFYMSAPYYIYRRTNKRLAHFWMAGGLVFGMLMSIARIAQGGHFLSDTVWAWGMVHLTAVVLFYLLRLDRDVPKTPANDSQTCST
jgi:membrane-associated PAP2 superfamily phosphatase